MEDRNQGSGKECVDIQREWVTGNRRNILYVVLQIMVEFIVLLKFAYSNLVKYKNAPSAATDIIL